MKSARNAALMAATHEDSVELEEFRLNFPDHGRPDTSMRCSPGPAALLVQ